MRLLVVELLFIASSLPLWRHEFDLSTVVDVDSYVVLAAAFWTIVFTADIARVWLKSRPRKQRIKGFEAVESGVPHGHFIRTGDNSFTVFLRTSELPWQGVGQIFIVAVVAPVLMYLIHMMGLMAGSTMMRISIEVFVCLYSVAYLYLASSPTRIEINETAVIVDGRRLSRAPDHFQQFYPGLRLSYTYGNKTVEFGRHWSESEAVDIAKALNELL
jgi:hypothetical protein